jgi:hypothetical protein
MCLFVNYAMCVDMHGVLCLRLDIGTHLVLASIVGAWVNSLWGHSGRGSSQQSNSEQRIRSQLLVVNFRCLCHGLRGEVGLA